MPNRIDEFVEKRFGGYRRKLAEKIGMDETHLAHIASGKDCFLSTAQRIAAGIGEPIDTIWPTKKKR